MTIVPPDAGLLRLTEAQSGAQFSVRTGQAIEVRLSDPSPARPDWTLVQGPPDVIVTARRFAPGATHPGSPVPDGPGADVIALRVRAAPGRTVQLSFTYRLSDRRLTFARIWHVRLRVVGAGGPNAGPQR